MAEAGWYEDPAGPTLVRYWDGHAWTERLCARPTSPAASGVIAPIVPIRPQTPVVAPGLESASGSPDVPAWFVASVVIGIMAVIGMMVFAAVG